MQMSNSKYCEELLGNLKGYLRVMSAQLGDHPFDNAHHAHIHDLYEPDLINSYKKYIFTSKIEIDPLTGEPYPDGIFGQERDFIFSELFRENKAIAWLENFFLETYLEKIKFDRYLVGDVLDLILFINDGDSFSYVYHCDFENKIWKGIIIFIPCKNEQFIVISLHESIEKIGPPPL